MHQAGLLSPQLFGPRIDPIPENLSAIGEHAHQQLVVEALLAEEVSACNRGQRRHGTNSSRVARTSTPPTYGPLQSQLTVGYRAALCSISESLGECMF
jgi:hypothetical protein